MSKIEKLIFEKFSKRGVNLTEASLLNAIKVSGTDVGQMKESDVTDDFITFLQGFIPSSLSVSPSGGSKVEDFISAKLESIRGIEEYFASAMSLIREYEVKAVSGILGIKASTAEDIDNYLTSEIEKLKQSNPQEKLQRMRESLGL